MIAFRAGHPVMHRRRFFTGDTNQRGLPDIIWHGCQLHAPGWSDPTSSVLAFTLGGSGETNDVHVMLNMSVHNLDFDLPPVAPRRWHRAVDTALPCPHDIASPGDEIQVKPNDRYRVNARSVVVLISQ